MGKLNRKIRVLVALSGGVDSSVAAALLVKAGYDVTAAFMINYDDKNVNGASCWVPDYRDAVRVAAHLGIKIIKLDFIQEYKQKVLDYMFAEYQLGRTPNPDVLCNTFVKFGSWLNHASHLGFDYLATGHYARLKKTKTGLKLLEAKDKNKDQTYFLHGLNQGQLSKVMFPVGDYAKPKVRKLAQKFNLPTAQKAESMGICFVGEVPMQEFLQTRIPPQPGKIVLSNGQEIGTHNGLPFYTIGQRHIGAQANVAKDAQNKPLYVLGKNLPANQLVVGFEDDPLLYTKQLMLSKVSWVGGQPPKFPLKCQVRIRHRQPLQKAVVKDNLVVFSKPQRAATPGQFAVFYKNGECLGGGVVEA